MDQFFGYKKITNWPAKKMGYRNTNTWGLYHKTYYSRNLRISVKTNKLPE
jgi:hypothetical protein